MTLTNARQYLARVVAWPHDAEGYINIHTLFQKEDFPKPAWGGRACRNLDEAVRAVDFALKNPDTRDIYVCMSTQKDAREKELTSGRKLMLPVRSTANALLLKALFLDIDVKPNAYPTTADAITALGNFLKATDLPKPTMFVSTGSGGLHCYWVLADALPVHEWQPLAFALAEATKKEGLMCDTQCTVDAARVLRVPDTFNFKKYPSKSPVTLAANKVLDFDYANERIERALKPYMSLTPVEAPLPKRAPIVGDDELSAGIKGGKAAPAHLDDVAKECAFVAEALTTAGKDFTNPLWTLTTLIATFTDDARNDAHRMASGHPGYSVESTDELFDRKERERDEKDLGWPKCTTISGSGCKACQTCPHLAGGQSPLKLARPAPAVPAVAPAPYQDDLPDGYQRRFDGVILRQQVTDAGQTVFVPVCPYAIEEAWIEPRKQDWILHFTTETVPGRKEQVRLPFAMAVSKEGLPKTLASQSMPLKEHDMKPFREFIVSYLQKLRQMRDAQITASPFGWVVNHGRLDGFSFGGRTITPSGERVSAQPDPQFAYQYTPVGNIDPWRVAAKMITDQKRPDLDAIIAAAFAGPLVRFTGQSGLLMSAYSMESGIGKSTTLKIAQAVWGDPIKAMQSLNDTPLSVINKIGAVRSLPLFWDELKTEEDTKKFVNLTFQLSLGKERSRLQQDASQRAVGTWQTMLVSASNDSLIEYITRQTKTTTAGLYRIFEYVVRPGVTAQRTNADASRIIAKLNDNYGRPGELYADFLGKNFEQVDKEVAKFLADIEQQVNGKPDERFWVSLVTCIVMGARYANQLGLTEIDEEALLKFMLTVLGNMRDERDMQPVDMKNVMNVADVLARFLGDMRARHTLKTDRIHVGRGKPGKGTVNVIGDASKLDAVYVQIGVQDGLIRVDANRFSMWLESNKYSRHIVSEALKNEFLMKWTNGRLGSGTDFAGMTQYILEFNTAGSKLKDYLDG